MNRRPPIERVAERCIREDRGYLTPCRIFTGAKDQRGYGMITIPKASGKGSTTARTHVITYEFSIGPVPEGLELDHLCRQHDCCQTSHLEAVTHAQNVRRGKVSETNRERCAAVTHCPQGHEYSPDNTLIVRHRDGYMCRKCKTCNRDSMRRRRTALAALVISALLLIPTTAGASTNVRAPFAGPTATCDFEHRMEIQVIDGVWFECMCLALSFGWDCAWVELPDPPTQIKRRIKPKPHQHRHVVIYPKPSVVA